MTVLTPLFLLAALAGVIPVLLHMINRRKAPRMRFSTLRFLRVSVQRTRRRKYLHDVLLLLLRVAVLVIIAVALARPTATHLSSLLGGRKAVSLVIVLDNSASMATRDQSGVRWERAQQAVEQVLDQLRDGDEVALLPTCGPASEEYGRLHRNHEVVREAFHLCRVSREQAHLTSSVRQARSLLEATGSDHPNREIYVVTDLQANAWEQIGATSAPSAPDDTRPPGQEIPVLLVDVHGLGLPNVALRQLSLHAAAPVVNAPFQVSVEVLGDLQVPQQRSVELIVDGQSQGASPNLALAAGGKAEHRFTFAVQEPGSHQGEVRLVGEDASPADDRLYFALNVDPRIPVAVVRSQGPEIDYLGDAFYLERALAPVREGWAVRPTPLTPTALETESLAPFAVVFCVNLPALDLTAVRRLREYVEAGGHLVWICGENVDPVRYNAMHELSQRQLLPAAIREVRELAEDRPDGWRVGWLDPDYPPFAPCLEPASLYQSILVRKHVRLESLDGAGARVLARLDDGEPLLVQRSVGAGSVLLLGISTHVDWSNLPLRPIFVPLVSRLTFHLAGIRASETSLVAGQPLVALAPASPTTVAQITRPDGAIVQVAAEPGSSQVRFVSTHELGVYRLAWLNAAAARQTGFAVNPDPAESDGTLLSRDDLPRTLALPSLVVCDQPEHLLDSIRKLREGESLMESFLIVVLVVLVVETFVANRRVSPEEDEKLALHRVQQQHRSRSVDALLHPRAKKIKFQSQAVSGNSEV